ncbi:MAG: pilus assembly protein TadG-related protein [Litoreibacter sp.]
MAQDYKPMSKPDTGIGRFMNFSKAEDGGATLAFGLFTFVIMLAAGGMAVDFMLAERERAEIQYTLDRAILAGAALSQPLEPEDVVRDYFDKSGIEDYELFVDTPEEANSLTSRRVEAAAASSRNNNFLKLVGINDLTLSAGGAAEERVQNVEISLVLDVSGSMGSSGKMANMQAAAKEFVNTVLTSQNADRVSINIVPYNMQVNAGEALLNEMNVTSEHDQSHCIDFTNNQFNSTAYDEFTTYQRTGHFDPYYTTIDHPASTSDDNDTRLFMCPSTERSEIVLLNQSITELENAIDDLEPGGNTSIDIGVRWGSMLLDPSMNSVLSQLTNGDGTASIDSVFAERPSGYSDDETIKILVVMTDGINTDQYTLSPDYASGVSNVWLADDDTIMSIEDDGFSPDYFLTRPYNTSRRNSSNTSSQPRNTTGNARQLSWPEVWSIMGVRYNAYYNQYVQNYQASDYYDWRDDVAIEVDGSTKDTRLSNACDAAKTNDVVVFSIGFEVTTSSAAVMENCASSESHFYRVEGVEISDAFNAIAQTIQRLKLTN